MSADFIQAMFTEAMSNVDITALVVLMAIGVCIKHFKVLEKIENDLIPPVLIVILLGYEFIKNGFALTSVVTAIITAAVAIGLHTEGKNIFTVTILPKILEMLKKSQSNGSTDPPEEDGGSDSE